MSQPPPLIALCARVLTFSDEGKRDAYSSSQPYSRAVARAGGVPVLVPPIRELTENALTVLQHFDGVLLPGGGDVDPRRYGQQADDDNLYGITELHDDLDIAVCLAAIELDLPMLALCRGMQVLNVALGGTLQQDIGNSDHWMREHTVDLTEGCRIAQACGTLHLEHCHSVHHQGIDRLADPLVAQVATTASPRPSSCPRPRGSSARNGTRRTPRRGSRSSRRCTTNWSAEPPHALPRASTCCAGRRPSSAGPLLRRMSVSVSSVRFRTQPTSAALSKSN